MARIETTVVITRRPADVFLYLTDLRNAPEWTDLVDVTYDGNKLVLGTTGADTRMVGRKRIVMPWRVTAFEPPRRLALTYDKPFTIIAEFAFQPVDGGTRVTCVTQLRPRGLWRALAPVLAWEARKADQVQFDRVKAILERVDRSATVTTGEAQK